MRRYPHRNLKSLGMNLEINVCTPIIVYKSNQHSHKLFHSSTNIPKEGRITVCSSLPPGSSFRSSCHTHLFANSTKIRRPQIVTSRKCFQDFISLPHSCFSVNLIVFLSSSFNRSLTLRTVIFIAVSRRSFGTRGS